jgi:hypothetical protein
MKTKTLLPLILLPLMLIAADAAAQFRLVTLVGAETITLASNEVAEVTQAFEYANGVPRFFGFKLDGNIIRASVASQTDAALATAPFPILVSGPRTVGAVGGGGGGSSMVSLRVYDRATYQAGPATGVPASTVVIPTEPAGTTRVILESSADLVTWTAAQPGTYGSGSTNRFFRLRLERVN